MRRIKDSAVSQAAFIMDSDPHARSCNITIALTENFDLEFFCHRLFRCHKGRQEKKRCHQQEKETPCHDQPNLVSKI